MVAFATDLKGDERRLSPLGARSRRGELAGAVVHTKDTDGRPDLEVSVWFYCLDLPARDVARLASLLSRSERERADRLVNPLHASRFIVARARMREILGARCKQAASALSFEYGPQGKPSLEGARPQARFNLSHSRSLAMLGVSDVDLGVDIEFLRPLEPGDELILSPRERTDLARLPQCQRAAGFYNAWTRKEAVIKALGGGLSIALDDLDVTLAPGEPTRLLRLDGRRGTARDWSLISLEPAAGYVAAIAIASPQFRIRARRWPE